jgi:phage terminase Nu1 subunit (DNA packaging protein)
MTTKLKPIPAIANVKEFSALLGKSTNFVAALIQKGMGAAAVIDGGGVQGSEVRIDVRQALRWYAQHRSASVEETARSLLLKQQSKKLAMQNAVMEGELITIAEVESVHDKLRTELGFAFDAVPARITMDEAFQEKIDAEITRARNVFAHALTTYCEGKKAADAKLRESRIDPAILTEKAEPLPKGRAP